MGTNYNGEEHGDAIIPKVMDTIFSKVEALKDSTEFLIRVSFIEVQNGILQIFLSKHGSYFISSWSLIKLLMCRFSRKMCLIC